VYSPRIVDLNTKSLEAKLGVPIKRYTIKQCEDFAFRMKDIVWDKGNPSRPLSAEETSFVFANRLISKIDFEYFLTRFCKILTDEKKLETIIPWPSQRKVLDALAKEEERQFDSGMVKIIIDLLKSRQVGGTVIGEALVAHLVFLNANTQGLIASDHPDMSLKLYQTLTRMYDHLPGWLAPPIDGRVKGTHLHFPTFDSDVIVGAGNQKTTLGQGMNIDVCHLTELSTWEFPNYIDADLMPAFKSSRKHHSVLLFESTGAGAKGNWFHDQFMAAWRGEMSHKAIFAAWYLRPTNRLDAEGVEFKEHTHNMAKRVEQETGEALDREQLAYYQLTRQDFEVKGDLETFFQEFPSTVEEAFQTGLRSVWSIETRSKVRDGVAAPLAVWDVNLATKKLRKVPLGAWKASEDEDKYDHRLIMWEPPKANATYVVAVDASYGIEGGDNAAIQVIKVGTPRWKDEQVAEWCGNINNLDLAKVAWIVGHAYRDKEYDLPALMAVETNPGSPGGTTQIELQRMGYSNFYIWKKPSNVKGKFSTEYGWWTTPSTRPLITDMLKTYIERMDIQINSPKFVDEMQSFVDLPTQTGKLRHHYAAAPGYHDDRIMAMAFGLYIAHELDVMNIADERRRMAEAKARILEGQKGRPHGKQLWEIMASSKLGETPESVMAELLDKISI
jgi:hypothetical protein